MYGPKVSRAPAGGVFSETKKLSASYEFLKPFPVLQWLSKCVRLHEGKLFPVPALGSPYAGSNMSRSKHATTILLYHCGAAE